MEVGTTPRAGDLVFVRSKGLGTPFSIVCQKFIDQNACDTDRDFGHVAIAISEYLALEAVPGEKHDDGEFELPDAVDAGYWTGSELRGGVRLTPIADIVVPALLENADFAVLRAPGSHDFSSALSISSPFVLRVLGSRYSADELKDAAFSALRRRFGSAIERFADKLNWTSTPIDFSTRLALDADLRSKISETLPDFDLPEVAQTYFCSQLAISCLQKAHLLDKDGVYELLTPTGLYALLCRKWVDVTEVYQSDPNPDQYLYWLPTEHQAHYLSQLHIVELHLKARALELQGQFIRASMDKMNRFCEETTTDILSRYNNKP